MILEGSGYGKGGYRVLGLQEEFNYQWAQACLMFKYPTHFRAFCSRYPQRRNSGQVAQPFGVDWDTRVPILTIGKKLEHDARHNRFKEQGE